MRDDEIIERPADQRTITKRFTEEAIGFIQQHRDRPFFLYLAHSMPHVPLFASTEFEGRSPRGIYGDAVEEIDWSVGRIIDTLRELRLDEQTLVIFTSDNGPWLVFDTHGGSAGPLRGGKGSTRDGGMRVPAIAWWAGTIAPGQVSTALATTLDIFPTALELAGAELPTDREIDGVSLVPLLLGERQSVREVVYYYRGSRLCALRKGPWKAHFITQPTGTETPPTEHATPELYQLENDPSERHDVAAEHPEIIEDLTREVERHRATVRPVPSQLDRPAIPDGGG